MLTTPIARRARQISAGLVVALAASAATVAPALAQDFEQLFAPAKSNAGETVDHSAWTKLLQSYVKPSSDGLNRVDYAAWKAEGRTALNGYVATLEGTDVTKLGRNEQFAFWTNLYNAKTIDVVLDAYPVESIRDISLGGSLFSAVTGGPWDAEVTQVNGVDLTLNNIEHDILRPLFVDPRIHYGVNCASIGCPNLGTEAFTGDKLEAQLDAAAKDYVNNSRGVAVTDRGLVASKIYSWFSEDFGGNERDLIRHLSKYAEGDRASALSNARDIYDYEYDWGLNDVGVPLLN